MNLIEGIQKECERARELKEVYDSIPTGKFGSTIISLAIKSGEEAIASGDTMRMITSLKQLQELE